MRRQSIAACPMWPGLMGAIHCLTQAAVKPGVDYQQLPPPVRYEELQREVMSEPSMHGGALQHATSANVFQQPGNTA